MSARLLREPLVHFFAIGVALFVLFDFVGDRQGGDEIVVTAAQVEQLSLGFSKTWQRPPTQTELTSIVEDHIREEVFYREAVAMGLDQDDQIVRRRMRQKLEFFAQDLADAQEPSDDELRTFLKENSESFRIATRLSFDQIYFSPDRRGERAASDASALLGELNADGSRVAVSGVGDSLPLPAHHERRTETEVASQFGRHFARALTGLEVGLWSGPLQSGFGLHVVRVRERLEGALPELDAVRDAVAMEWQAAQRTQVEEDFYRRLLDKYAVHVEGLLAAVVEAPDQQARADARTSDRVGIAQ